MTCTCIRCAQLCTHCLCTFLLIIIIPAYLQVCAYHEWNLDGLVEMVWEYLDLVRCVRRAGWIIDVPGPDISAD